MHDVCTCFSGLASNLESPFIPLTPPVIITDSNYLPTMVVTPFYDSNGPGIAYFSMASLIPGGMPPPPYRTYPLFPLGTTAAAGYVQFYSDRLILSKSTLNSLAGFSFKLVFCCAK